MASFRILLAMGLVLLPAIAPAQDAVECSPDESFQYEHELLTGAVAELSTRLAERDAVCAAELTETRDALEGQLTQCQFDERRNRRVNVTLSTELSACEERLPEEDGRFAEVTAALEATAAERDRLATALAEAEARAGEALARLDAAGVSLHPSFRYEPDLPGSYVALRTVTGFLAADMRLEAEQCAAALDWLSEQTGAERPLRPIVWVWEDGAPRLCRPNGSGQSEVVRPVGSDEAHYLRFR